MTVEEVQEMTEEPDAVEDNDLGAHFAVEAFSVVVHFAVYRLGGDENIVVDV